MRTRVLALIAIGSAVAACSCGKKPAGPGAVKGTAPVVTITAPADGTHVKQGAPTAITGTATDKEDGNITANLTWSDSQGEIPATAKGGSISATFTKVGGHLVTASVTDKDGNKVTKSITINVDQAPQIPTVVITRPQDNSTFPLNQTVTFTATATDFDGTNVSSTLVWTDDKGNFTGAQGATIKSAFSTSGAHVITATATGKNGTGSAMVHVTIQGNHAPVLTIVAPKDGGYVKQNVQLTLTGTATDVEDGNLSGRIQWTVKDASGAVVSSGAGASYAGFTPTALADYTVEASVTDNGLPPSDPPATTTATITIHSVNNLPPICNITRPQTGDTFFTTDAVNFQGICTDPDSPTPTAPLPGASLHWSDTASAWTALGANATTSFSATGGHTIKLCADDAEPTVGNPIQGCTSIDISIIQNTPPTCASLTAPTQGQVIQSGSPFQATFSASDAEDPAITGRNPTYRFVFDTGAAAGNGQVTSAPQTVTLASPNNVGGSHVLTLTVSDSANPPLTCTLSVTVMLNRPPVTAITAVTQTQGGGQVTCTGGTGCTDGFQTDIAANVTDPDGDPIASWTMTDSVNGAIGSGTGSNASLSAALSAGKHRVALVGTDSNGATSTVPRTPGLGTGLVEFSILPAGGGTFIQPYGVNDDFGQMLVGPSATGDAIYYEHGNYNNFNAIDQEGHQLVLGTTTPLSIAFTGGQARDVASSGTDLYFAADDRVVVCPLPWSIASTCNEYRAGTRIGGAVIEAVGVTGGYLFVGDDNHQVTVFGLDVNGQPQNDGAGNLAANAAQVRVGDKLTRIVPSATPGQAWALTDGSGAFLVDSTANRLMNLRGGDFQSSAFWTAAIGSDTDVVYFGTDAGISQYRISTNTAGLFDPTQQPYNAPNPDIYAIAVDTAATGDVVWFGGAQTGLFRGAADLGRPSIVRYTRGAGDGLSNDTIYTLAVGSPASSGAPNRKYIGHKPSTTGGGNGLDYTDLP